jgi:hypothetical protein
MLMHMRSWTTESYHVNIFYLKTIILILKMKIGNALFHGIYMYTARAGNLPLRCSFGSIRNEACHTRIRGCSSYKLQ